MILEISLCVLFIIAIQLFCVWMVKKPKKTESPVAVVAWEIGTKKHLEFDWNDVKSSPGFNEAKFKKDGIFHGLNSTGHYSKFRAVGFLNKEAVKKLKKEME